MTEPQMHYVQVDLNYLNERSQRELNAYRSMGTLKEIRLLKHQEMLRIKRRQRIRGIIEYVLAGTIFVSSLVGLIIAAVLSA